MLVNPWINVVHECLSVKKSFKREWYLHENSHCASPFQEIMLSLKRFFSAETVTWQKKKPNAKDLVETIL